MPSVTLAAGEALREPRVRILALVDYFVPGYKAGGPIRTLSNMIARLGDEYSFRVVTRDRDLGSSDAYPGVTVNEWSRTGKAEVFYASPTKHLGALMRLLHEASFEVLYLNSFFSWKSTILPLILLRSGFARNVAIVLAPRGEFSQGALELKARKKRLYIMLAQALGLCNKVIWQASSADEAKDIHRVMKPERKQIIVAPNLLPAASDNVAEAGNHDAPARSNGPLRIVFLSRISPMKNLDFLLRVLKEIDATLLLDIYGPTEDLAYWERCIKLISELPANVRVNYRGTVPPDKVNSVFTRYDLFVFPTRGENFGHVIIESLNAGTPVLLSDQTPWRADPDGAIEILRLNDEYAWRDAIIRWCRTGSKTALQQRRYAAKSYVQTVRAKEQALELNRQLFERAVEYMTQP